MMKKIGNRQKALFLLVGFLSLGLCACGTGEVPLEDGENYDETSFDGVEGEAFSYVDARGNRHSTTINPRVDKHDYNSDGFYDKGDTRGYEDDHYYSRRGIDVSAHQGAINWELVKEEGYEFAIIRAGFRGYGQTGSLNIDEYFEQNLEGAKAYGLDVGVYFFSQAISEEEAEEEAEFVLDILDGRPLALGICFDPESITDDDARTDGVSGEQFTRNTLRFCEKVEEGGYEAFVYSNMIWEDKMFEMEKLNGIKKWYADYESRPQTPYAFEFWQFSETGTVDGIYGPVDLDIQILPK